MVYRFRFPAPPATARRFRTDDLDEARGQAESSIGPYTLTAGRGAEALGCERVLLNGQHSALAWGRLAVDRTIRADWAFATLQFCQDNGATYRIGGRSWYAGRGEMMLLPACWAYTRATGPGDLPSVHFIEEALWREVRARRPGDAAAWSLRACVLQPQGESGAELTDAVDDFAHALAAAEPIAVQLERSEARLIGALAEALMPKQTLTSEPRIALKRVARLEDWIDAHLAAPLTLGRLCKEAGVGDRTLQLDFQARRGMSPMRFVVERRLAAARRRIDSATPGDTVTSIALDTGFSHMGRFSASYRQAFGETPLQTLRRRQAHL